MPISTSGNIHIRAIRQSPGNINRAGRREVSIKGLTEFAEESRIPLVQEHP